MTPALMSISSPLYSETSEARLCGALQVWSRTPSIHPTAVKPWAAPPAASSSMLIATMCDGEHFHTCGETGGREVSVAGGGEGLWEKWGRAAGGVNKLLSYQPAWSPRHTIPARTPGEGDTRSQTPRLCSQQTQRVYFPACFHTSVSSDESSQMIVWTNSLSF